MSQYDAVLLVSFGGPEQPEDVMPFLENVVRGRNVPRERLMEVADHYHHFDGRSPINDQNRALLQALEQELATHGPNLPIYWGNRNWHPMLPDTLQKMKADGVKKAVAFVTSAFSSYSGCRQYRENIAAAQAAVGEGAPEIEKIRVFYDYPEFQEVIKLEAEDALNQIPENLRAEAHILFTAHSIPLSMAQGCKYVEQLNEASASVAKALGRDKYSLVYQSRSGPPQIPWLEPDVLDALRDLKEKGTQAVVIVPIGFVSDHLEVLYDLDTEAKQLCEELGITMSRAATAGTHPLFVRMIRDLIVERMEGNGTRPGLCTDLCCLPPRRP
jgi:protoporphyrin/coproporphyrin ferrochelatase